MMIKQQDQKTSQVTRSKTLICFSAKRASQDLTTLVLNRNRTQTQIQMGMRKRTQTFIKRTWWV